MRVLIETSHRGTLTFYALLNPVFRILYPASSIQKPASRNPNPSQKSRDPSQSIRQGAYFSVPSSVSESGGRRAGSTVQTRHCRQRHRRHLVRQRFRPGGGRRPTPQRDPYDCGGEKPIDACRGGFGRTACAVCARSELSQPVQDGHSYSFYNNGAQGGDVGGLRRVWTPRRHAR